MDLTIYRKVWGTLYFFFLLVDGVSRFFLPLLGWLAAEDSLLVSSGSPASFGWRLSSVSVCCTCLSTAAAVCMSIAAAVCWQLQFLRECSSAPLTSSSGVFLCGRPEWDRRKAPQIGYCTCRPVREKWVTPVRVRRESNPRPSGRQASTLTTSPRHRWPHTRTYRLSALSTFENCPISHIFD